jgi:hypothetical protein
LIDRLFISNCGGKMRDVDARKVRYIKLGTGGNWVDLCLKENSLLIDHREVPHEVAATRDRAVIRDHLIQCHHLSKARASGKAREILDFYDEDEQAIWITFANGFLYWCRAEAEVIDLGADNSIGTKMRLCGSPWSNQSHGGKVLRIGELNGHLTRTAAYRQTICSVAAKDYLLAKLNDEDLPEVSNAIAAKETMEAAIADLIGILTWRDFELLVDLIFVSSGWRRTGAIGGTQETVDTELVLPSTGERAFVQIKSEMTPTELNDYVNRFELRDEDRMFFVYHTAASAVATVKPNVTVIDRAHLAALVMEAGLAGWLIQKVA